MQRIGKTLKRKSTSRYRGSRFAVALASAFAAALLAFSLVACAPSDASTASKYSGVDGFDASDISKNDFRATPSVMDSIPQTTGLETFTLTNSGKHVAAPKLASDETAAIKSAISAVEEYGDVSLVLINLDTGCGIAYNPDAPVYGAGSFKAPYALYICETFVENGAFSIPGISALGDDDFYGEGSFVKSLIENAVVNSDNDSFATLRGMYDFQGFDEWITALGATDATYTDESWFPWYSARSSAKLWAEMLEYWRGGSDTALWLQSLCAETNQSFLRDATEPLGAEVLNKAGWCSGYDYDLDFNSICDAGVVRIGNEFYLASVMTGAPDDDDNRALVEELIAALFTARDSLA